MLDALLDTLKSPVIPLTTSIAVVLWNGSTVPSRHYYKKLCTLAQLHIRATYSMPFNLYSIQLLSVLHVYTPFLSCLLPFFLILTPHYLLSPMTLLIYPQMLMLSYNSSLLSGLLLSLILSGNKLLLFLLLHLLPLPSPSAHSSYCIAFTFQNFISSPLVHTWHSRFVSTRYYSLTCPLVPHSLSPS